jgi:hypothetical protein
LAVSYSQQGIARKNARNRVAEMAQRGGGDGAELSATLLTKDYEKDADDMCNIDELNFL